ncbi:MAG: TetR/AcrR family transcriptional regulator [Cellvibrionaceae bacterium]|nr:TetR/AcrR family transcriptional regulator [Cellvibrionaceae bacterium]
MARPSVKAERTEEILDAFERCVARLGVEGTTLERIAEESGLRRSLLRYHIGNRSEMVQALADRYIKSSRTEACKMLASMPESETSAPLLDYLFINIDEDQRRKILVAEALVSGADLYPEIKHRMNEWYSNFVMILCRVISVDYPDAEPAAQREVAWGLISLVFNVQMMVALGGGELVLRDSRRAAERLLLSLKVSDPNPESESKLEGTEELIA